MAGFDVSCVKPIDSLSGGSVKDILFVHKNTCVPDCYISRGNGGTLFRCILITKPTRCTNFSNLFLE
jgi:hypothetical protein